MTIEETKIMCFASSHSGTHRGLHTRKKKIKKTLPLGDLGVLSAKPRGRDRRHITYTRNDFKRRAGRVYKKKTNVEVTLLGLKKCDKH
jgi:hypothetical protein